MSLILEALRRSEAERQLGHAPDVLAPMPVLRVSQRGRRGPWLVAVALVFAALALIVVWRYASHREPAMTPAVAIATSAAPATAQVSPQAQANIQAHAPISAAAITAPTIAAIASQQPPPAVPRASISNAVPQKIIATAQPAIPSAAITPSTPTVPAPTAAASETAAISPETLQSIADLAPAERAALPTLKVSMHVYAEQAGDRFMIVDGARVGEGARIGDRIVLVQIRRDGGVLDIGGRRVLLPKP